ncbi:MAG TPA: flagellar biosynthesis protein FlhF, partial [Sulfurospirillum sp. UBA12182]
MKFLTFSAQTPAAALKQAQLECGEDALVVSTKQVKKKGINTPALYEVVVAIEDHKQPKKVSLPRQSVKSKEDVLVNISEAAKQISNIAKVTDTSSLNGYKKANISIEEKAPNGKDDLVDIKQEITKLADKIKLIQEMFWEEKAPQRNNLAIPPEFSQ